MADGDKKDDTPKAPTISDTIDTIQRQRMASAQIAEMEIQTGIRPAPQLAAAPVAAPVAAAPVTDGLKMDLHIGELIGKSQEQATKMMEIAMTTKDAAMEARVSAMTDRLGEMQRQSDESQAVDPMAMFFQVKEIMSSMTEEIKGQLGLGERQAGGGDLSTMIEVKKLEATLISEGRRHESDMADRRHQWDVETEERRADRDSSDRRWAADFGLKKAEQEQSTQLRNAAVNSFGGLMSGVINAVDQARQEGFNDPTAPAPQGAPPPQAPSAAAASDGGPATMELMKCGNCGEMMPVTSNEVGAQLTCPHCDAVFEIQDPNA